MICLLLASIFTVVMTLLRIIKSGNKSGTISTLAAVSLSAVFLSTIFSLAFSALAFFPHVSFADDNSNKAMVDSSQNSEAGLPLSLDISPVVNLAPLEAQLPVANGNSAEENKQGAEDKYNDSKLYEALQYVHEHHPQLLAKREELKAVNESVDLAVSRFRPSAELGYERGRERKSSNDASWEYDDSTVKSLTVTQPIFNGLSDVAAFKAARQRLKAARADMVALEQQILYNVIVAYSGVVETEAVLAVNQNNVAVHSRQRDATAVRFEVGELTKTDVAQAEARLARAIAEERKAAGDFAVARAQFVRAVGYEAPEKLSMPLLPSALPKTLDEASSAAELASPVIIAAQHREKAFENDVKSRIGEFLPRLSLQGKMSRSEGNSPFTNSYDNDSLTLNLKIPLYQSGAEWSRLREARSLADKAHFDNLDLALAVEQNVASAWYNYLSAQSVISSSEAEVAASEIALNGVRSEHEFGVRTVLDVLDAEQEFMNAQITLINAQRNHKIQAYRLLASVGKLTINELSIPVNNK